MTDVADSSIKSVKAYLESRGVYYANDGARRTVIWWLMGGHVQQQLRRTSFLLCRLLEDMG